MHFSCKISNAVLTYLEEKGEDLSVLYDSSPLDVDYLRNSSSWVSAPDMERFLETVVTVWPHLATKSMIQAGHHGFELRPWGVLDSVLRMMPHSKEAFQQPERFLAYFIAPEPPVENIKRTESSLEFDLPLMAEQYPLVTTYLRSAFEGLPRYSGHNLGHCIWENIHVHIEWPQEEIPAVTQSEPTAQGHSLSPALLQNVIEDLQKNQRELETRNRELQQKNEELLRIQKNSFQMENKSFTEEDLQNQLSQLHQSVSSSVSHEQISYQVGQNLARLHDYMVRAQQLITILASNSQSAPALKNLYRKLDWENVKLQYPRVISDSVGWLRELQSPSLPKESLKENLDV